MTGGGAPLRCFFGHHKCATRWLLKIIRQVGLETGGRVANVSHARLAAHDLGALVASEGLDYLCYTNARWEEIRRLPPHRGFHVIRDPRDLCVSAYYSHLASHEESAGWPELTAHRERLRSCDLETGLHLEIEFSRPVLEAIGGWRYDSPTILEVRYEELTAAPGARLAEIFAFLDALDPSDAGRLAPLGRALRVSINRLHRKWGPRFPVRLRRERIPLPDLQRIVAANSFRRLSRGRRRGAEDPASHYRRGTPGDWLRHFSPRHVEHFKELYGDVLLATGYERDGSWTVERSAGAPA